MRSTFHRHEPLPKISQQEIFTPTCWLRNRRALSAFNPLDKTLWTNCKTARLDCGRKGVSSFICLSFITSWLPHYRRNTLSEMSAITNKTPDIFLLFGFIYDSRRLILIVRQFKMTRGVATKGGRKRKQKFTESATRY